MEAEEAVIANPGELQVGVEDKRCKAVDLRRMTRRTSLYGLQDTQQGLIILSRIQRKLAFVSVSVF